MPAWPPDINPFENVFNRILKELAQDVIEHPIKHERFELSVHVKKNFAEFPAREKDKTIDSILKQIKLKT